MLLLGALLLALFSCKEILVETPDGFAPLEVQDQYAAMSPEGMIYRVRVMKNQPKQNHEFWSEALRNHLEKEGYLRVSSGNEFQAGSLNGSFSEWTLPYGDDTYKYLTAILVAEDTLAVAEASGRHEEYGRHRSAILDSLETIDFRDVEASDIDTWASYSQAAAAGASTAPGSSRGEKPAAAEKGGCFLAGTPVVTEDGLIPIEAVWPGTSLRVYDPVADRWGKRQVVRTIGLAYSGDVVAVETGSKTIKVTGHHPFLVADGRRLKHRPLPGELSAQESLSPRACRWVEARDLRRGDTLVSLYGDLHGAPLKVDAVSRRHAAARVFHLSVSGPHTYAVEHAGSVVHNGGEQEAYKAPVESERAAREREIIGSGAITASLPTDARSERIRVYSGACSLMIDRVEPVKRQIADMAEEAGGYVEESSGERIIIRVPAGEFRNVFDEILDLGEVLYKAIETYDVTDKFTDSSGRLAVAMRARDRLYVLLNRIEDAKERLEILKKIREYTEIIERLELSSEVLEKRIAMSRITVELHSRLKEAETIERPVPFPWIERLHPLYETTNGLAGKAEVPVPDDVAVFEQKGVLRAEAADGTRIRLGTVKNDPRGDSLFWQRALSYHLGPRYRKAETIDLDPVSLVLFTSKKTDPYYYLVGAMPLQEEPTLVVFEAYFPDEQALEQHYQDILEAFGEVQIP